MKHDQQTKVIVTVVLERDLLSRQPCGFWDTSEGGIETTVPYIECPKEDMCTSIWKKLEVKLKEQHSDKFQYHLLKNLLHGGCQLGQQA